MNNHITKLTEYNKRCQKQGHENEKLVMICLNKKCDSNLLCCINCIDEEHSKHEIVSLKKFQKMIQQNLQKYNKNKQKGKIVKLFSDYQAKFVNSLKLLENQLIAKIQNLQCQITGIFRQINQILSVPTHRQIIQQLIQHQDVTEWSSILQSINLSSKYNVGTVSDTTVILAYQLSNFKKKIKDFNTQLNSKVDLLKNQIKNFNFCSFRREQPIVFHPVYKYTDMQRQDNVAIIQKKKNNGNRTIALGSRPLDPINNSVKFRIIKNGDGIPSICIGAAILSIVKQNNFTNCNGHKRGVYCIDQSCTSNWGSIQQSNQATYWSNDSSTNNMQTIGFQFNQGDTVEMTIDFQEGAIIFQMGEQIFDMDFEGGMKDLYPFVCLSNSNSVVQIVE